MAEYFFEYFFEWVITAPALLVPLINGCLFEQQFEQTAVKYRFHLRGPSMLDFCFRIFILPNVSDVTRCWTMILNTFQHFILVFLIIQTGD